MKFLLHLQVNLEYLARVVFNVDRLLYPDSLVGTDSHTTMINGLGILGWGECNLVISGGTYIPYVGKFRSEKKLVNLANCGVFTNILLANYFFILFQLANEI